MCVNELTATRPSCFKHSVPCTVKLQFGYNRGREARARMRLSKPEDSRELMSEGS